MTFLELHKMYRFWGREFGVCIRTFRFLVKTAEERLVGVASSQAVAQTDFMLRQAQHERKS